MSENTPEIKTMRNAIGQDIPVHMVKEFDRLRDELVRETVAGFERAAAMLTELKTRTETDLDAFLELSSGRFGEDLGGKKGNVTIYSYDGKYKVSRQISDYTVFDEGLAAARELLDRYLNSKLQGADADLRLLVDKAFRPNASGKINTSAILSLRSVAINHPDWIAAMHAISESLKVVSSNACVRVYKADEGGGWSPVCVNYSSIIPAKASPETSKGEHHEQS
jgi:hypothetical protein